MKVAIITEGLQGTGYGHLTRCLSIYQAFEEKNIIPIYIANCDEEGKKFIPDVNLLQLNWLEKKDELINQIKDYDIAVIDSYLAPLEIYEQIYKVVKKTVCIDDYIRLDYPQGVIVNGTIGAEILPYKTDEKHKYLLGVDYMPLRKEFWDIEIPKRENEIKNILITFGAQDSHNLTSKILSFLLNNFPHLNYHVVIGSKSSEEINKPNINYYYSINAEEMLLLMLRADLAVSAAGQTTYELARIGIPTVAIGVSENQRFNLMGWLETNFINEEIWAEDSNMREKVERNILLIDIMKNKVIVDGQGARRIVNICIHNG